MKIFICLVLIISFHTTAFAQITDDFENGQLNGWYSEGDGTAALTAAPSGPGSSLEVADNATGSLNYAIAPAKYLGDWSGFTIMDSIVADFYVASSDPDELGTPYPVFEISGPGGRASALIGQQIPRNTWNELTVKLDPAVWTIESGDWNSILADVEVLRIRAEFITGPERVYLDNINLSRTPIYSTITDDECSIFETETPEGWRFENVGSFEVAEGNGNPGVGVKVTDASGTMFAVAPSKFLGNWSMLAPGVHLQFDLKIDNLSGGALLNRPYLVRLTGNNSVAEVRPPDSEILMAVGDWRSFEFPMEENAWTVTQGTWSDLLQSVSEFRINLEWIFGSEQVFLDNVCLSSQLNSSGYLPVRLQDFTATTQDNKIVALAWSTSFEVDNDHFRVERSARGVNWLDIGRVDAHVEGAVSEEYVFADNNPLAGVSYYRLRQIDHDGSEAFFGPVEVSVDEGLGLKIFPNPANDVITIVSQNLLAKHVEVFDMLGRSVAGQGNVRRITDGEIEILTKNLTSGTYLVRVGKEVSRIVISH